LWTIASQADCDDNMASGATAITITNINAIKDLTTQPKTWIFVHVSLALIAGSRMCAR
jgi:hypothetical protein